MRIFRFILVFSLSVSLFAQDTEKIIQQINRIDKKQEKTEQDIAKMLQLSKEVYSSEPDLVLGYLKNLKPLIEKQNYYHGWEDYCYLIRNIYIGEGKLSEAEKIISGIYGRYAGHFSLEEEVSIRLNLVFIVHNMGETERSQAIIKELLPKAQTDYQRANLYYTRGFNYKNLDDYKKAVEDCFKAIELYKSIDDQKNLAIAYDFLGGIYRELNDYKKALHYSWEALRIARESHNYLSEINVYTNVGAYYRALGKIDSTLYFYDLSIVLARKHNRLQSVAQNLMNMGNVYSEEQKNYAEAEKYYQQSLDICRTAGIQYGMMLNWFNLGKNYQSKKEYPQSKSAFDSAMIYAVKLKMPSEQAVVEQGYYEFYKEKEDYRNALIHYEKFDKIKQDINLNEQKKQIAELQTKYNVAVKDKKIEKANNEINAQKSRITILILIIFLVVFGTGSIIYFLVYRNRSLLKLYERNVELSNSSFLFEVPQEETEETDPLKKVFLGLIDLMENKEIYKESNLSVNTVAHELNTNRKYLSNAIAIYAKKNFNNFINSYRIKEARQMILSNPQLPLNEVMYLCGFNSRTPFYMAFQKYTGMSPQQFKDLSVSQNKKQPEEATVIES